MAKVSKLELGCLIHLVYRDHLRFNHAHPEMLKPVTREAVGWLVYECPDYVIVNSDGSADPPSLKGGDPNADGRVLLRTEIPKVGDLARTLAVLTPQRPAHDSDECVLCSLESA